MPDPIIRHCPCGDVAIIGKRDEQGNEIWRCSQTKNHDPICVKDKSALRKERE